MPTEKSAICLCAILLSIITSVTHATPLSEQRVSRFLMQATLGFDQPMLADARAMEPQEWIQSQLGQPANLLQPYLDNLRILQESQQDSEKFAHHFNKRKSASQVGKRNFSTAWLRAVLSGNDALRQKVAWALSQILVVSNDSLSLIHI